MHRLIIIIDWRLKKYTGLIKRNKMPGTKVKFQINNYYGMGLD